MDNNYVIKLFVEKKDCCGCAACMNICSQNAISMKEDEEGFVYPQINEEMCVKCARCLTVCPIKCAKEMA